MFRVPGLICVGTRHRNTYPSVRGYAKMRGLVIPNRVVMVHRSLAILSLALVTCFLLLGYLDPRFWFIHLYESLIYLAIFLLLCYRKARWAYMLGIVAPVGWVFLALVTSGFGEAVRQIARLLQAQEPNYTPTVIGIVIAVLSITMANFCAYRWKREFRGLNRGRNTFLASAGIVAAYYTLMMVLLRRT